VSLEETGPARAEKVPEEKISQTKVAVCVSATVVTDVMWKTVTKISGWACAILRLRLSALVMLSDIYIFILVTCSTHGSRLAWMS